MTEAEADGTGAAGQGAPEPLEYRFTWTRALYREITGGAPPELGLTGSRRDVAFTVSGAVALMGAVALLPPAFGFYPLDGAIIALWGAAGGLLAVLLVVIPHMRRARIDADLATRLRHGEVRVRLSAEGVESESQLARGLTRWAGVAAVSETPRATLIWLGALVALPVPDAALPEGVSRGDVLSRIAAWREAAR